MKFALISFPSFIFILSLLVQQNIVNALRRIFFKTVIKMSARYGENEWKTRDGDFKMKEKFQKKSKPFSRRKRDRNFSTHTANDENFIVEILRRDRAVESDWIIRESGK